MFVLSCSLFDFFVFSFDLSYLFTAFQNLLLQYFELFGLLLLPVNYFLSVFLVLSILFFKEVILSNYFFLKSALLLTKLYQLIGDLSLYLAEIGITVCINCLF